MPENQLQTELTTFDEVYLIRNPDPTAGFCALLVYALNGIRYAEAAGAIPIVWFDRRTPSPFYDPARGENIWEYYFFPVAGYSLRDLELQGKKIVSANADDDGLRRWSAEMRRLHHRDPERICTFWAYDKPQDPRSWLEEKRRLARRYVHKYVRVQTHISQKVQRFVADNFTRRPVAGCHLRGTDFEYADPTAVERYFEEIDRLKRYQSIFIAADQEQFVDAFRQRYGNRVVAMPCLRSTSAVPSFSLPGDPYQKGEDVLMDVLLLSHCDYLLRCAAAAGECALWFNEKLQCTDFALESEFDSRPPEEHQSAFEKLKVDRLHHRSSN